MATPGTPPVWCFGSERESDLLVTVVDGSIRIYEVESDHEVRLRSTGELVTWLNTQRPGSLQPQKGKPKHARFFEWE